MKWQNPDHNRTAERARQYFRRQNDMIAGEMEQEMNITDIKIRKLLNEGRLKAIVSITLDDTIALHDIKIIEGPQRLFVAMPSRRDDNGIFRDIVHPISSDGRASIEENILNFYSDYLHAHPEALEPREPGESRQQRYFNPNLEGPQ